MALSSISGATQGTVINSRGTFVPSRETNIVQTAGTQGLTGRGGDTYYCASCGGQRAVSSFYCPTCSGGSSARTATPPTHSPGSCVGCATQSVRSATVKAGTVYYHTPAVRGR